MAVQITDKLVNIASGEIFGYLVSAGGTYKVAITEDYGKSHGIEDIDIAVYLDVPAIEAVPIHNDSYAMVSSMVGYIAELSDTPVGFLGDLKAYYGYLFKEQNIVPLNSQRAFDRMLEEFK